MSFPSPPNLQYSRIPTEPTDEVEAAKQCPQDCYVSDGMANGHYGTDSSAMPDEVSARLGMAKALKILGGLEHSGSCNVEKSSVYGAALVLSQVARCTGWPGSMCGLMFRSGLFVLLNYFVQTAFVYYIYDSQTNMNPYGGQMHLCDFAAHISECPNRPDCHGPGGEEMPDPGALYPYDIWVTRKFVRDSLMTIFPKMSDKISENFDPGEYGIESYYCRLLCVFVFVLQIADEFQNIRSLVNFLRQVPTEEGLWVRYDSSEPPAKDDPHGKKELEKVQFKVAGMPMRWKIIVVVFILLPRIFIWRMLTLAGVHFLMETAAMVDQIVNTTALSFVLTTDELILERLATSATIHILTSVEGYNLFDYSQYQKSSEQDFLASYEEREMRVFGERQFPLVPYRLVWAIVLMALFTLEYYWHNCVSMEDGSVVSVPVSLPATPHIPLGTFFKKFLSLHTVNDLPAFWTMPGM